jgi:hypothetical protein
VTVIDGRIHVVPSYARVRLWDDSVQGLMGSADALPLLTPTWEKRYLPLNTANERFVREPLPLGALYFLREREPSDLAPRIENLSSLEAFPELLAHMLTNRAVRGEAAEVDFRFCANLLHHVPAFSLTAHADPARLPELCSLVAAHAATLHDATNRTPGSN